MYSRQSLFCQNTKHIDGSQNRRSNPKQGKGNTKQNRQTGAEKLTFWSPVQRRHYLQRCSARFNSKLNLYRSHSPRLSQWVCRARGMTHAIITSELLPFLPEEYSHAPHNHMTFFTNQSTEESIWKIQHPCPPIQSHNREHLWRIGCNKAITDYAPVCINVITTVNMIKGSRTKWISPTATVHQLMVYIDTCGFQHLRSCGDIFQLREGVADKG